MGAGQREGERCGAAPATYARPGMCVERVVVIVTPHSFTWS